MVESLANDFARCEGTDVSLLVDHRLKLNAPANCHVSPVHSVGSLRSKFQQLARQADWTMVIAPETQGCLLDWSAHAMRSGGRLLGADLSTISLATNKHRLGEFLRLRNIPSPRGILISRDDPWPSDWSFPKIYKPLDGAGCVDTFLIDRLEMWTRCRDKLPRGRLEEFRPGLAASISLLCGAGICQVLPAGAQRVIQENGQLQYAGGELPLRRDLTERAIKLGRLVADALPGLFGFVGIDLVLGEREEEDAVIEVNPRLTTSYVGLRAACRGNLAHAMLEVAAGRSISLEFDDTPRRFDTHGHVSILN